MNSPELNVVRFNNNDVIATSGTPGPGPASSFSFSGLYFAGAFDDVRNNEFVYQANVTASETPTDLQGTLTQLAGGNVANDTILSDLARSLYGESVTEQQIGNMKKATFEIKSNDTSHKVTFDADGSWVKEDGTNKIKPEALTLEDVLNSTTGTEKSDYAITRYLLNKENGTYYYESMEEELQGIGVPSVQKVMGDLEDPEVYNLSSIVKDSSGVNAYFEADNGEHYSSYPYTVKETFVSSKSGTDIYLGDNTGKYTESDPGVNNLADLFNKYLWDFDSQNNKFVRQEKDAGNKDLGDNVQQTFGTYTVEGDTITQDSKTVE